MREIPSLPDRFLVIETDAVFSGKLSRYLYEEWPDASVCIHTPCNNTLPDEEFAWSQYDVLFLGCDLGEEINALEWLAAMRGYPFFPVTILLADSADSQMAVRAIKAGADDYLAKEAVSWASIYAAVIDAVLYSKSQRAEDLRAQRAIMGPEIEGVSIDYKLNQGGFSALYLGTREQDGKKVVIKTLLLDKSLEPSHVQRFKNEAAILSGLNNKYVVGIIDHVEKNDSLYIITEYFPGGNLRDFMQKGPVKIQEALQYLIQLATGLAVVHAKGIVHRDLKPSNIMFREDGGLALIDFGIAKQLEVESSLTLVGEVLGTPSYMSPEHGSADDIDERSDIYSLGVIFYEMLSGRKPYQGSTAAAVVYQHSMMPVPRLPYKYQKYQPFLEKMMAKNPAERFQSSREILLKISQLSV